MSKEMQFFILLLEQYSFYKGRSANDILQQLEKSDLMDLIIYKMYEKYHQEAIENAFEDIDKLILEHS